MRIGRARQTARRAVHAYARRLGVPPPLVRFTYAPQPDFSAYTYEGDAWHVVVFSHEALLQPAWAVRSIAAHEMGHVKERHYLRTRRAALMLAVMGIALAWCAPIPWWVSLLASIGVGRMALRVADVGTHIQHEIEADRWAARFGAMAVRRRELFGKHEPSWFRRATHAYIIAAIRKAT